ncbi:prion-like-(Q/N-rich) domain-bearing protein 25 [Mytilus californianus]|uniref:prion-like-(Q/N-rich) domain-bearing protein 25 n=1 Tax=Mytilus californianus TaxID=6549 RepID=UPI002247C012|nr:prion-like-(Q/N-rich) domain-bearing protein 25 [Mytilus californianus]
MSKQYFLNTILLVCLLCITCESSVRDSSCTFDNVDSCTKYGNAKCNTNNCRCMEDYYDDGSTCQKKSSEDSACGVDEECLGPMTCISETCQCSKNSYWTGSACATNKRRNVFNCHDPRPEPTCDCSIRQYCRHSNCYHKKSIDLNCNADKECLSPMTCKRGTC